MKKQYWINVRNVDNRLVIFFDGETIWDSGIIRDDPAINKNIEITDLLKAEPDCSHELIFEGFNNTYTAHDTDEDLNPWHFNYRIFTRTVDKEGKVVSENDLVKPYDEKHLSNPHIRAINNSYRFVRKNHDYKVVANSLSQHFFD
ncbi:MAG: hypothetical protein JNN00_04975 [Chitinophagaceae bacterium]|nr:hypothetical protein [Chitinophagaceae bacterium]